jgi:hypothetical protein
LSLVATELRELDMTRGFRLLLAISAGAVVAVIPQAPASAATGDLACFANFQFDFDPPLTADTTTSEATGTAALVNCTSANGNYSPLKSATFRPTEIKVTSQGGAPCNLLLTIQGSGALEWSPAGSPNSRLDFVVNTDPSAGSITLSAMIADGPMAGDTATAVPLMAHPNPDCATAGLSSLISELSTVTFD